MAAERVDFLTTGLEVGGAETQLVRLATALKGRGWHPRIISMIGSGPLAEAVHEAGVPLVDLGMKRGRAGPGALPRLIRILRQDRSRSLVSFMYHANILGRVAGRPAGVPRVISAIRNERFGSAGRDRLLRWTDPLGHVNVINSRLAASALRERGLVPARGLQVIPNGIALEEYALPAAAGAGVRAELGIGPDEFVWLAVGRLVPQKDPLGLLRAFALDAPAGTRLVLAGGGPLEGALREAAAKLGVGERVSFPGVRRDVPALLAAADAFVLASAWEGLPNVLMEAHAARLPVVATRVGGVGEIVTDGETGYLCPAGSPEALGAAMRRLESLPPARRLALGQAGHHQVRCRFGMDAVTDRWETLLSSGQRPA